MASNPCLQIRTIIEMIVRLIAHISRILRGSWLTNAMDVTDEAMPVDAAALKL